MITHRILNSLLRKSKRINKKLVKLNVFTSKSVPYKQDVYLISKAHETFTKLII